MTIKVLIADDHKLFRQGLISLMKTREDLVEVIGEAETGEDAIRLVGQLHPDVVLMDIYMPHGDGLYATKEIRERFPGIAVVLLTASENDEHLYEAVKLGVSGYLLKSLDAKELFELLAGIIRGAGAACILHICADVSHITGEMALSGYDGLSLDSAVDLAKEADRLPKNLLLIGNIDARRIIQRGSVDDVRWETRRLLRKMSKVKNFIVSTACDVPIDVPIRNLEAMIEETHLWKPRSRLL